MTTETLNLISGALVIMMLIGVIIIQKTVKC